MATVAQYVTQLRAQQVRIARKFGVDLSAETKTTRVLWLSTLVMLATLVKALVDKGVLTDAELQAAYTSAGDDPQVSEPVEPSPAP